VRPESYVEINNFYTTTVYNKGAEVIRMYHTLLGPERFREGLRLYLSRHDGQAATVDDFLAAMAEAGGRDLSRFALWYSQAGTPELAAEASWDEEARSYTLSVRQSCPATPGQEAKEPFHIPLTVGLLDAQGREIPLRLEGETAPGAAERVLELTQEEQTFRFVDVPERPVPSLLRDFSAPVTLRFDYSDGELAFLMAHDGDPFNRWEAGQQLVLRVSARLVDRHRRGEALELDPLLAEAFAKTLLDTEADEALLALALTLPAETFLGEQMEVIDPEAVRAVRQFLRRELARTLEAELIGRYRSLEEPGPYSVEPRAVGRRSLKNLCLATLMTLEEGEGVGLCLEQLRRGGNMTDELAALSCLADSDLPGRQEALDAFYGRWRHEPLVLDKWFTLQAASKRAGTLAEVKRLAAHPDFNIKNPNRVRALVGAFSMANPAAFHAASGEGYAFIADRVLELDPLNPMGAARLAGGLSRWRRYDEGRQRLMRGQLKRILDTGGISRDLYEVVSKSLG
ncbi:DUF3458 domain-containing protein, partial [Desulfuromonas sp.]|uniref:DUF3458 domain-containing protein n=1 Tax=Desulfuromonas sp. TaxID=892 RepID=UPI003418D893